MGVGGVPVDWCATIGLGLSLVRAKRRTRWYPGSIDRLDIAPVFFFGADDSYCFVILSRVGIGRELGSWHSDCRAGL